MYWSVCSDTHPWSQQFRGWARQENPMQNRTRTPCRILNIPANLHFLCTSDHSTNHGIASKKLKLATKWPVLTLFATRWQKGIMRDPQDGYPRTSALDRTHLIHWGLFTVVIVVVIVTLRIRFPCQILITDMISELERLKNLEKHATD